LPFGDIDIAINGKKALAAVEKARYKYKEASLNPKTFSSG
jgi:hypothetical protein